ncbi:MAG TPA: hypothetical protein VMP01_05180 [Pirellulaceae bacterium]|nr:hypothetical protein [Pirellulaceae bacterium]
MNLRREQLLGYLLGALERAEQEQVEHELAINPRLREELAEMKATLDKVGLNDPAEPIEPPAGLAERTCQFVAELSEEPAVALPPENRTGSGYRSYTLTDVLVAASVLVMLGALLFPSLARSRFLAQMVACQNNLRQLGMAMLLDSETRPDRSHWPVPWKDHRAVAGMTASSLVERQFVCSPDVAVCATSDRGSLLPNYPMPMPDQWGDAAGDELRRLQRLVGGSYAYPLGYNLNGQIVPSRNTYREHYCLVAEAPQFSGGGSHAGLGGNVFFEDGHIRWIDADAYSVLPDDPYRNRLGQAKAAGVDIDDAVLGASDVRPLPPIVPVRHK